MMGIAIKTSAPWYFIAFIGIFVLIGAGLAVGLVLTHYQRWRIGKATLTASPASVEGGDVVTLRLQIERADLGNRDVHFALESQEEDDGWTTRQSLKEVAPLHSALRQASVSITLPDNARASSARWRWQANAKIDGLKFAPSECDVTVRRNAKASGPSVDAIALNASQDSFASLTPEIVPTGATEIVRGVWQWSSTSRALQVIGLILLGFALFWLWNTSDFGLVRALTARDGISWGTVGVALFGLPFLVGGIVVLALALSLLTLRTSAVARRGEIVTEIHALGRTWSTQIVRASEIAMLQASASMSSGPTVLRYALAARTARGASMLPLVAKSIDELAAQARWLAGILEIPDVIFDPQLMNSDEPRIVSPVETSQRKKIGRWVGRLVGGSCALGFVGFALIFVWSLWSAR